MFKKLKPYMMPVAITIGAIFYRFFNELSFVTPYLIFVMLFLTYCKMKMTEIRLAPLHAWMIIIQLLGSVILYLLIRPFNELLAQATMMCVLAPTATAAPVITGMLQGDAASVTAYSLLSNLSVAVVAPVIFSFVGSYQSMPFFDSLLAISQKVVFLLITPVLAAFVLGRVNARLTSKLGEYAGLSFYLWSFALCVVSGRTVSFILEQSGSNHMIEVMIAIAAFLICVIQFLLGRKIGSKYDNTIAGGQGLGQKNTILAIWMAQTYLNPIASLGPGAYVLWQNTVNSYQIWRKRKML